MVSKLGLLLAIPPGYATAIWPASGIALGCLLIYGIRLWPGVLLGSAFVNLSVSYDLSSVATFLSLLPVPMGVSIGAALQAVIGAVLIRRYVSHYFTLADHRDIMKFLALGGPLACLVNATVGSSILLISGTVPSQLFLATWWTWWVGDSIGVLIFTPLMLIGLAPVRAIWSPQLRTVGAPLLAAFVVSVTMFNYTATDSWAVLASAFLFTGLLGAFLLVISGQATKVE